MVFVIFRECGALVVYGGKGARKGYNIIARVNTEARAVQSRYKDR